MTGRELAEDLGIEEGRKKSGGGGGGSKGGGGGKKKGMGMMGMMMMGIGAKMAALVPLAIGGLFLLALKAFIIAKIALLLSGIIAVKKLLGSKQGAGGSGGHSSGGHSSGGWQSSSDGGGGHGGGWQSSGGGWDKRSLDEAQNLAYKAHVPQ
ncbi:hypothetical protein JTB14_011670 [Gonioctena quinquepunctata]|nr:hypothetical protein JTB14_011670 [Gonioctena quinquepunctata]